MSRNKLILVSLAGMFMLAQSLYAQKSGLTYTIAFNGYCDGATVTVGTNGLVTGTHNNYDCDGSVTWLDGITSTPVGKFDSQEAIGPVSLADNVGVLEFGDGALTLYLNFKNNTWSFYYEVSGIGSEVYDNSGTFSVVEEAVTSGGKVASWQKRQNFLITEPIFGISGYPTGTYELLLWDSTHQFEYCDFFQLTENGDLVGGVHNLVTGCGYPANAPTGGNYTFLGNDTVVITATGSPLGVVGVGGRGLLTTDNEEAIDFAYDYTLNYYFNFQSNLWTVYGTGGTTGLQLDNWGDLEVVEVDPLTAKTATHPVGGMLSKTPHSK